MIFPRGIEDVLEPGDVTIGPFRVLRASIFPDSPEDGEQTEGNDALFIDDVDLVADGEDRQTSPSG